MYEKAGGSRRERPTISRSGAKLSALPSLLYPKHKVNPNFRSFTEIELRADSFSTSTDGLSIDRIPTQSNDAQDQLPDRVVRFE